MTDDSALEREGDDTQERVAASYPIPPYIPFATFLTFLGELKTNGIPPQIDNSVLKRFSGGTQAQLKSGLKAIGLITSDGAVPTPGLVSLVEAYETDGFDGRLLEFLKGAYPYVFALDLMTATPTMFADAFKVTGAKEDVSRKCRTFFLFAAKKAGVPLGQRLQAARSTPTPGGATKRKTRTKAREDASDLGGTGDAGQNKGDKQPNAYMDKLLDKFPEFDPTWPDPIKAKWFEGFDRFMKGAKS